MSQTPFDPKQKEGTDRIHREWRDTIYPAIFRLQKQDVTYDDEETEVKKELDYQYGCDRVLWIKHPNMRAPMKYTAQERFRDEKFQRYQDLTVTEWNNITNKPSELYKLAAALFFTYGYYNHAVNRLIEVVVVNCPNMINCIINGSLKHTNDKPNYRSSQTFRTYKFDDLKRLDLVLLHWREINEVRKRLRTSIDPPALKPLPYYGNED
jgi:hypothetical protein